MALAPVLAPIFLGILGFSAGGVVAGECQIYGAADGGNLAFEIIASLDRIYCGRDSGCYW